MPTSSSNSKQINQLITSTCHYYYHYYYYDYYYYYYDCYFYYYYKTSPLIYSLQLLIPYSTICLLLFICLFVYLH